MCVERLKRNPIAKNRSRTLLTITTHAELAGGGALLPASTAMILVAAEHIHAIAMAALLRVAAALATRATVAVVVLDALACPLAARAPVPTALVALPAVPVVAPQVHALVLAASESALAFLVEATLGWRRRRLHALARLTAKALLLIASFAAVTTVLAVCREAHALVVAARLVGLALGVAALRGRRLLDALAGLAAEASLGVAALAAVAAVLVVSREAHALALAARLSILALLVIAALFRRGGRWW